ncbi:unnamed protein product [Bubo scandiacus]
MSERPASHPRVALEEVEAAQESSSLPELCDVSMVQLLQADDPWAGVPAVLEWQGCSALGAASSTASLPSRAEFKALFTVWEACGQGWCVLTDSSVFPLHVDGTLPEQENPEHPDLQAGRDADSTRLPPSLDSSDPLLPAFLQALLPALLGTRAVCAAQPSSTIRVLGVTCLPSLPSSDRKMQVLLPDIMETLRHANTDVKMKSLVFFRNMMGHVKRKEASLIALQLAEKLLPLFDDESSQLREFSIRLFKDVMKTVVGRQKKKMAKKVQSVLLPLFLHRNDQTKSVAKASRDTFVACTEFLGWRMANYMPEPYHTHLIGEFLLAHDRSRVEEYLCQSLPYLEDTQASMREAAVRFIGLGVRHPRNISKKKMREICNALQPLVEDTELSVRSLAAETIFVLSRKMQTSRWSLKSLCRWCC